MTNKLHKLAPEIQRRLLSGGAPRTMEPVLRDAWASLYRWHEEGEHVYRIRTEARALDAQLNLVTAEVMYEGCCYELPGRSDWIVIARHKAREPIVIHAPQAVFAFPEPMLTYCTEITQGLASGTINLVEAPNYGSIYLPGGKSGARWLHQDEIAEEERRLRVALPHFFQLAQPRPPSKHG